MHVPCAMGVSMRTPASIAGHPIHPMLIPFPLALWATSFAVDILFYFLRHPTLLVIAKFMIAAGCLGAIAAAIPGIIDWLSIKNSDVKRVANWHARLNVAALVVFAISFVLRTGSYSELVGRRLTFLRLLLDEIRDRRDAAVERVVEGAVDPYGCRHPDCANDGAAGGVAGDDRRRERRCKSVEQSILTGVDDRGNGQHDVSGQKAGDDMSHAVCARRRASGRAASIVVETFPERDAASCRRSERRWLLSGVAVGRVTLLVRSC